MVSKAKLGKTAPMKSLDKRYGNKSMSVGGSRNLILAKLDKMTQRAEASIESMLFTFEEKEAEKKMSDDSTAVTVDTSKTELASGLTFSDGGEDARKLTFEDKDSLAL